MSSQFHHPQRSLQEWFDLITLCRQSGLSDYDWCKNHDIPASSFYNAVSKLRKKAVQLPDSAFHCDLCIKVTLNGIHYQGICLMA